MTNNKSLLKNKTYEEVFGIEKALQIKQKLSEARKRGIEEGRIASWNKGKKLTEDHVNNLRKSHKSQIPWNKNRKGVMPLPWNKGIIKKEIKEFIDDNTHKHLCKCGCGKFIIIKKFHYSGGIPSFILGHHILKGEQSHLFGREPPNKGKSMIHSGTFTKGHSPSKVIREKMSETRKSLYQEGKLKVWNKGVIGPDSHSWKGGLSNKPYTYDFSKRFKEAIKQRDNYCCKLCNIFEEDHLSLHGKKLYIHHIDYIKVNTFPQNCITLCIRCNSIVNFNRQHWTTFFQSLLKEQYGYLYTQDQKIILDFTDIKIDKNNMEANNNETNKS